MAVYLSPVGGAGAQFFDNNGDPLTGGKLYTYAAGTTTPQTTYTSSSGVTAHSNPIVLDAAGRVSGSSEVWLQIAPYKFILKTSDDITLGTWDNVSGFGIGASITGDFTGDGITVNFTLASAPRSKDAMLVYINGVYQQRNTFSISNAVLTFSAAPPVTSSIEVLYS